MTDKRRAPEDDSDWLDATDDERIKVTYAELAESEALANAVDVADGEDDSHG
jgi:hypothetical protein